MAYAVAVTFPISTITKMLHIENTPTVGLSTAIFFLFASITFEVQRKWYYQSWMMAYLALGFIAPHTNAWMHLYGYICGLIYALINYPIKR